MIKEEMKDTVTLPHSITENGIDLKLVYATPGGLILSPYNTKEECEDLYNSWMLDNFTNKQ
jgi:hypothetical protein